MPSDDRSLEVNKTNILVAKRGTYKNYKQRILGDSGTDSGGEGKSKRPFGTGLVRHCLQGLFWPFFTFLLCHIFPPV